MHVLCAPDSFKETLGAGEAARAMAQGVQAADPGATFDVCPIADGGDGTLDVLIEALGGEALSDRVVGPLGDRAPQYTARFGVVAASRLGIVELAQASGLDRLAPDQRDPMRTTTFGTGQLIRAAIERRCEEIIVCIGGSATVDGGCGLAQALGAAFYDDQDQRIEVPITGSMLETIARIERPGALPRIRVACDVTNPLTGLLGAAAVYGPQKGAAPREVQQLDHGLAHLAQLTGVDPDRPGYGAAGGTAFGLVAFCGARLERGIDLVLRVVRFEARCRRADLVLTGEGRLDAQSLQGKACLGAATIAHRAGLPCLAIVGQTGAGAEHCTDAARGGHLTDWVSLAERYGLDRAMTDTAACLRNAAQDLVITWTGRTSS